MQPFYSALYFSNLENPTRLLAFYFYFFFSRSIFFLIFFYPFFFFFIFSFGVSIEHISKINRSVLNLEAWGMLGFQLRSSTNVPSCYCYALRVLCVALKKGEEGKKIKNKIKKKSKFRRSMQWPAAKKKKLKKISLFYHRRDINIPPYWNIYIYGFICLY